VAATVVRLQRRRSGAVNTQAIHMRHRRLARPCSVRLLPWQVRRLYAQYLRTISPFVTRTKRGSTFRRVQCCEVLPSSSQGCYLSQTSPECGQSLILNTSKEACLRRSRRTSLCGCPG
jgi:hypothetical protein